MGDRNFTYRFDLDRDYFIDISMRYQSLLPFVTLATIRPLVILILMKKRDYISWDIRLAYVINQVAMTSQEFNFCFLFRVHDLAPYSGLYCDGPICRMGIDKQYLMAVLSLTTIGTVPTFLILLIRMHQRIIETTDSPLKLSKATQFGIILFCTLILLSNVAGFYSFGRDCKEAEEMEKVSHLKHLTISHVYIIPDLAWLKERGGTLFLFGPPGRSEFFRKELFMLLCSIVIIAPFVAVATFHSMKIMREQKLHQTLTSNTQRLQTRVARVFFLQLLGVNCFYLGPLTMMLLHMAIDVSWILPPWMYSPARCGLIIPFTLESCQLSLIFLLKNPMHRKIIRDAFLQLSHRNKTSEARVSVPDRNQAWAKMSVSRTTTLNT